MQHQQRRALARKLEEQAYWVEKVETNQLRAVLMAEMAEDLRRVANLEGSSCES